MTGKEQVQEMARIIGCCKSYLHPDIKCHSKEYGCYCAENPCYNERVALRLYSQGYRKIERGKWEDNADGTHWCSECGHDAAYTYDGIEVCGVCCPFCGADMRKEQNDDGE